uniref:Uncharacterized protein n=1 Tax=Anguilla anguilla TaxID=7936 RepID=A0A0E9P7N3_ANGAN
MIQMSNNARHFQTREYSYRYCRNGKSYLFYFLKRLHQCRPCYDMFCESALR